MVEKNLRNAIVALAASMALAGCLPAAIEPPARAPVEEGPNTTPVITGTPATNATAGTAYSFQPSVSDPDGQTLTFNITNKPAWASFSTTTGRLSGTPGDTHVGTTYGIVIRVTDIQGVSASLPAFSITVSAPAAAGTATLSWVSPSQYTDGSPLPVGELSGFRIYKGTSNSNLTAIAEVDSGTTTFVVQDLANGTHYFAVAALAAGGMESDKSTVRSKTIR